MFEYSWGQYIARNNGLKAYNFSEGGMSAKKYLDTFAEEKGFWDTEKACQAYVIALGVNDLFAGKREIGMPEDIEDENKTTFIHYYGGIVKRYKEISPDAKFFFVTLPNSNLPEKSETEQGMRAAMYALAEYFDNSYVIDLYKYGPVYDKEFEKKYFMYKHMTPSGYILTAKMIDSYIDYIIRHNPDDFKTAAFIGTDVNFVDIIPV